VSTIGCLLRRELSATTLVWLIRLLELCHGLADEVRGLMIFEHGDILPSSQSRGE
jgi:hypothetical protein